MNLFILLLSSVEHPVILSYLAHLTELGTRWAERARSRVSIALSFHRWNRWWNYLGHKNCIISRVEWRAIPHLFWVYECCDMKTEDKFRTYAMYLLLLFYFQPLFFLTQWVSVSEVCLHSSHFILSGSSCTHYKPAESN